MLEHWLTPEQFIGFCRGNALKYLARAGKKGSTSDVDLAKAEWYTKAEIAFTRREGKNV